MKNLIENMLIGIGSAFMFSWAIVIYIFVPNNLVGFWLGVPMWILSIVCFVKYVQVLNRFGVKK